MKLSRAEVEKIARNYSLGKVESVKEIKGGAVNFNFILKTSKGRFIIRILGGESAEVNKDFEFWVLNYLKRSNFPYEVPQPIKNLNGKYVSRIGQGRFWVYRMLEGSHIKRKDSRTICQMAHALARLDLFLAKIKKKGRTEKYRKFDHLAWLAQEYKRLSRTKPRNPTDRLIVKNAQYFQYLAQRVSKISYGENQQWAHMDLVPENVLFKGGRLVGIIDFDAISYIPRISDVSYSIESTCRNRGGLDRKKIILFLKEYEKINPLAKKERQILLYEMLRDRLMVFWWLYARMGKAQDKKYAWMKDTSKIIKSIAREVGW